MAFPVTGGRPDYAGNFIPEIWSGKLIENFYDSTVLAAIANTDYEGEIKAHGDTVNIRTTPELTIRDYIKGQDLTIENPDKPKLQLLIDKGEYFAAVQDDVDKTQSDINLMQTWTRDASEQMKIKIDTRVLRDIVTDVSSHNTGDKAGRISGNIDLNQVALTKSNILDTLVDLGTVLDEVNCPESDRWLILPAKACGLIKKSDLRDASIAGDGTSILRNGRLGMIDRFTIYHSNLLHKNASNYYHILAGHKKALTFASQMTEMETIRSERTFGDIVRGLQVYGYKIVKPEAMALLTATVA